MADIIPFKNKDTVDPDDLDDPDDTDGSFDVYEVMCVMCYYRYVAVSPVDMGWLKDCHCYKCKKVGGLIRTGQPLDDMDEDELGL